MLTYDAPEQHLNRLILRKGQYSWEAGELRYVFCFAARQTFQRGLWLWNNMRPDVQKIKWICSVLDFFKVKFNKQLDYYRNNKIKQSKALK